MLSLCSQEGEVYVYCVSATGVDGTSFSAKIRVPGMYLKGYLYKTKAAN